jgi:hypothetical protein
LKLRLDQVLEYEPPHVFIAVDGPRSGNTKDRQAHEEIQKILAHYQGDSRVRTQVQQENLGAREGMVSAINWFFEQVEQGVIIEDDIDFSPGFFPYMDALLAKYASHPDIGGINGWNPLCLKEVSPNSFFFTKYPFIYGWGTWRRTWRDYMSDLLEPLAKLRFEQTPLMSRLHSERIDKYWHLKFSGVDSGDIQTWDFSLCYTSWKRNLLYVCPGRSQTKNVGLESSRVKRFREQKQDSVEIATTRFDTTKMAFKDIDVDDQFDEVVFGFGAKSKNLLRLTQVWIRSELEKYERGRALLK